MAGASTRADAYISPGGRTKEYCRDAYIEDLMCLGSFMAWTDESFAGGYTRKHAWQAMCRLLDVHPVKFRKAIMGEVPPSDSKEVAG